MMDSNYISIAEGYIFRFKEEVENPVRSFSSAYYKENASNQLHIVIRWLELIKSLNVNQLEVENLFEKVYNFNIKIPEAKSATPDWYFVSQLFIDLFKWAKNSGLVTKKIKDWKTDLYKNEIGIIEKYYENLSMKKGWREHAAFAFSILKNWLSLINSNSATKEDIDSILHQCLSHNKGGSMYYALVHSIRDWAELEGFIVLDKEKVQNELNKTGVNDV